jgi:hypothetical protein
METRDAKHEPRFTPNNVHLADEAAVPQRRRRQHGRRRARAGSGAARVADARWVGQTADRILAVLEQDRSTWQLWHVRAEAQRQARTIDLPVNQSNRLVDLLVSEVLEHRSVALKAPPDGIEEPDALRRADGSSVYTIVGADRYTSQRILDAEQRILTATGRHDGAAVGSAVELALLEMAANGTMLDAGQAASSARCAPPMPGRVGDAPAGAGKTTAMRALTGLDPRRRSVIGLRGAPPSWPNTPGSRPTPWPNSPGAFSTMTCRWAAYIDGRTR